jgi:MoaA/NifB/PqqE/SkfB family radical SAM enzyme
MGDKMKLRKSSDGLHVFDRRSGVNILFDEVSVPRNEWSRAPRFVSFALTNLCDLHCPFCYAPKRPALLDFERVLAWSHELDDNGCLAIGFGGGEPTLYPDFAKLCRSLAQSTELSIGFTTHGHSFTHQLRDDLVGAVHYVRVSMDGVGDTYEKIRGRSFSKFLQRLQMVSETSAFGINYVVNQATVGELDEAADLVFDAGATELLLLPEYSAHGLQESTRQALLQWISSNSNRVRLSISETAATEGMPLADPFNNERGMKAYVHVNAFGELSRTSYEDNNALLINMHEGILAALANYEGHVT